MTGTAGSILRWTPTPSIIIAVCRVPAGASATLILSTSTQWKQISSQSPIHISWVRGWQRVRYITRKSFFLGGNNTTSRQPLAAKVFLLSNSCNFVCLSLPGSLKRNEMHTSIPHAFINKTIIFGFRHLPIFFPRSLWTWKASTGERREMTMNASEVYDRQIRLWGLDAQKRMQEARVLFCGLRALGAEVRLC